MSNVTAEMAKNTAQKSGFSNEGTSLDRRYGQIGISAVAAAARYQGETKNQAYAPVAVRLDYHMDDAA
jgi:hypothetical protein